ncbi:hypothetical protein ACQPZP_06005 [Spirillospora sp. CA-142024]|uniref:hypothetical protein n=1 Tax=Spirillospora sp. CA-142024 TaxID=3240036 RepID=UPI003D8AC6C2
MRCPNCGTETSSASPRCLRCNAPLPPSRADDSTVRDPEDGIPVPREPVPPPWAGQAPAHWGAPPDHTTPIAPSDDRTAAMPSEERTAQMPPSSEGTAHMPPSVERTTQLSPEPWSEPWSEPAIWQPPAPPKRSNLPYFLAAAGVVLLIGLAAGIVLWPSGSDTPPAATSPSAVESQGASPATENTSTGTNGDLEAQAGAVDKLLADMGATRSELGTVVTSGCPVDGLQRILDARKNQLEQARALEVSALDNGTQMKDALVRALEASTESNQRYLDGAPGCPSEGEVADVNQRASSAKNEFIGYWTPIAEKAGLPTRGESDI